MTLYESNHLKFARLLKGILPCEAGWISKTAGDCDLHLGMMSRERYTSTFKLTYWFDDEHGDRIPDPDLTVRVYHDAGLVEAVGGRQTHHHHLLQVLARSHAGELDRRWRANMMLNKWLDYLLENGHSFA